MYNGKEAGIQDSQVRSGAGSWGRAHALVPLPRFWEMLLARSSGPFMRRDSAPCQYHKSSAQYAQNTAIFTK